MKYHLTLVKLLISLIIILPLANQLQSKIYRYGQDFTKYLKNRNEYTFFLHPTEETEIINIIKSINVCKVSGPHSIPTDILKLIKENIGKPLAYIVSLSFGKGEYLVPPKTSKTVPVFKEKGSKLDCSNYRPISLCPMLIKYLKNLCLKGFMTSH